MCGWSISKMSQKVKVGGVWKDSGPFVKIAGVWKVPESIFNKVGGVWKQSFLKGGKIDATFTSPSVSFALIRTLSIQSDGKIIIGGSFTSLSGVALNRIARLNSDGTLDTAFNTTTGSGLGDPALSIVIQPDGKYIVAGGFISYNGTTVNRLIRLNSNGTLDTAFSSNQGTSFGGGGIGMTATYIAIQTDGKIVVSGGFTLFNGTTANRLVRLNSDGTLDTTFAANIGTGLNSFGGPIAIQTDGKIIVGGSFTTFNGTTSNRIVRLNSNGTLDTTFGSGLSDAPNGISIQTDGKIIITGNFTSFNGTAINRVVRLNSNGTIDTAFATNIGTGANAYAMNTTLQSDGKIIVTGNFTTFNGAAINRIVRLNSDGTRDTAFSTNAGTGFSAVTYDSKIDSNEKIVIVGDFVTFNETTVNRITRIGGDFAG